MRRRLRKMYVAHFAASWAAPNGAGAGDVACKFAASSSSQRAIAHVWLRWLRRRSIERLGAKLLSRDSDQGSDWLEGTVPWRCFSPGRAIAQYYAARRFGETSPRRLSHTRSAKGDRWGLVSETSGAFNPGRIGDRSWVPHGLVLLIPRFRGPHGDHLGLTSFGGTIRLLARTACDFGGSHRHTGTVHPQVHGGSDFARLSTQPRSSAVISAPSASAARSTWLTLTSTPANSCSSALLSSKLTSAAVLPVIRRTPGVSENNSRCKARSRGQNPPWHLAQ